MFGPGPATASGEKTASAVVYASPCYLHGFEVNPPNIGTSTLKIWDSATATTSGKSVISEAQVASGQNSIYLSFVTPRPCNQGLYAELTNSNGSTAFVVAFSPF